MNLDKKYFLNGNKCNILQLVKKEPEWAANRIQEGEKAIEKLKMGNSLNSFCAACKENDCVISHDGTCAMIRVYREYLLKKGSV